MDENTDVGDLDKREKLILEIKELRKRIKEKHSALKRGYFDMETHIEKNIKPIMEPLMKPFFEKHSKENLEKNDKQVTEKRNWKKLNEKTLLASKLEKQKKEAIKEDNKRKGIDDSEEEELVFKRLVPSKGEKRKEHSDVDFIKKRPVFSDFTRTEKRKNVTDKTERPIKKVVLDPELQMHYSDISNNEMETSSEEEPMDEEEPTDFKLKNEEVYETPMTAEEYLNSPQGKREAELIIKNTFKGRLSTKYFLGYIKHPKKIDNVYGIRIDNNKWMIGDKEIDIDENDLIINGVRYTGTRGIYELLFMRIPDDYTDEDLLKYRDILLATNAHRVDYLPKGKIKSNKSIKYKKIISTLFPPRAPRSYMDWSGSGIVMKEYKKDKPAYIYWNDPNELCERLKLLIASQSAGNTGNNNEIISIFEELQEAGIIARKQ